MRALPRQNHAAQTADRRQDECPDAVRRDQALAKQSRKESVTYGNDCIKSLVTSVTFHTRATEGEDSHDDDTGSGKLSDNFVNTTGYAVTCVGGPITPPVCDNKTIPYEGDGLTDTSSQNAYACFEATKLPNVNLRVIGTNNVNIFCGNSYCRFEGTDAPPLDEGWGFEGPSASSVRVDRSDRRAA